METCTQKVKNFQILTYALRISTEGLKTYVDQCFEDLYDRLKRKICSTGACTQYCSKQCQPTKWCTTCTEWKREAEKFMRCQSHKNKVQWQHIEVSTLSGRDFENATLELCRIYVRDARKFTYDIHNMLSALQNCRYFEIGKDLKLLDAVRKVRNVDFAHTEKFKMSKKQLGNAVSILLKFFQHSSLNGFECILKTVTNLKELKLNGDHIYTDIELRNVFKNIRHLTIMDLNDYLSIKEEKEGIKEQTGYNFIKAGVSVFVIFVILLIQFGFYKIKDIMNGKAYV